MLHIFSILVKNEPSVLTRISSLFSRRNFNIHSLAVGTTQDPALSRITIILYAEENRADHIIAQINKSPVVLAVERIDPKIAVSCALALFKIQSNPDSQPDILNIAKRFRANILLLNSNFIILEISGSAYKINDAIQALQHFGILELIQSGLIALNPYDSFSSFLNSNLPFYHKNLL